jgi:PAS domain S-box-containing protein
LAQAGADETKQEQALRRLMEQFFDATTDSICFLDRNYCFTFLNRRTRERQHITGDLTGVNIFEHFPHTVYEGSPYVENYRRTMEEGVPTEFEAYYPEPLNTWYRVQCFPAEDGIILHTRDCTKEKQTHEAMQQAIQEAQRQHAELETIYQTAPIGLALFDTTEFRYLRLNDRQAEFFGLKPEQVVGRKLTEMAPIEGLQGLFEQVLRGEPVVNYPLEGALVTDPANYRYWTVSYFPVYAADGSIRAITAASLEITQQKKAEKALIQSEKLAVVGRLATSIAHEINNPMESVTNLLYLAQRSEDLQQVKEQLYAAEVELRRAAAITSQTLRFHKQATSPQEITATDLLESVLSVYQGRIANVQARVKQRLRAQLPVRCFEGEIRQVLSNLVGNALDALHGSGGGMWLRTREGTSWLTGQRGIFLTVADSGCGMSAETQGKLFQPFFTTKGLTGTGLGLWVTKEIVDRHGGSLCVRSSQRPERQGTVFRLFLPFEAVTR